MDCPVLDALADSPPAPLCVGFSGGLDSSVLLHALAGLRPGVRALHVDHGLQPGSAEWAARCRRIAGEWGVECEVTRVDIPREGAGGLEAAARAARYRALAGALPAGGVAVLAHHQDDQAETVLLRLLRRSGPRGLAAMRADSTGPEAVRVWRPFLGLSRACLQAYADRHGVAALDDPMNADLRFDRVFLRRRALPLLSERWPDAREALAASAALLAAEDGQRRSAVRAALARCRGLDDASLSLAGLSNESPALRRPLIEAWWAALGAPALPGSLLGRVADGLPTRQDRGFAALCWQGWRIERYRDELHASRERMTGFDARPWDGSAPLDLGHGLLELLGAATLPQAASVSPRTGGERVLLPGRRHRHELKHCLQSLGVPPWERRGLPLLIGADGELDAAGDLLYSHRFDAWLKSRDARLRWTPA